MSVLAMYLRLSDEDDYDGESNSITNQRLLISDYLCKLSEFSDYNVREFCDDGYSGMNMNRPGVKCLLDEVKKNKVKCIIVKDLSRFSRNYIDIGDYLDHIFPFWGVRFIAINDRYDSFQHMGATLEIDTAFKSIINDFYSKDLSIKVKSAIKSRCGNGEYVQGLPPIGYEKIPNHKNQIRVNRFAADIVKLIFSMSANGLSPSVIARKLNDDEIPTARQIKAGSEKKMCYWKPNQVKNILNNRFYLGEFTYNKAEIVEVGSKKAKKLPQSEWITIPNHHEAIVSEELFDKARYVKHKPAIRKNGAKKPLVGKLRCGGCGGGMRHNYKQPGGYVCTTLSVKASKFCCSYTEDYVLEEIVLAMLIKEFMKQIDVRESSRLVNESLTKKVSSLEKLIGSCKASINELEHEAATLYEKYVDGLLAVSEYKESVCRVRENIYEIEKEIVKYQANVKETKQAFVDDSDTKDLLECLNLNKLTKEIVDDFISQIVINADKSIEIEWAFKPI